MKVFLGICDKERFFVIEERALLCRAKEKEYEEKLEYEVFMLKKQVGATEAKLKKKSKRIKYLKANCKILT